MVYRLRIYNLLIIASLVFGMKIPLFADDVVYQDHGWAFIEKVRVNCGDVLFYRQPLGFDVLLPEGSIIIIKALKTGFGNYYTVAKQADGTWAVSASDKSGKKQESQFLVSKVGDNFVFTSEVADGFALASTPDFNVTLVSEKNVKMILNKLTQSLGTCSGSKCRKYT